MTIELKVFILAVASIYATYMFIRTVKQQVESEGDADAMRSHSGCNAPAMQSLEDKLRAVAEANPDGFTVDLSGNLVEPSRGYAVAFAGKEGQSYEGDEGMRNAIEHASSKYGCGLVGGWLSNGVIIWDSVMLTTSLERAHQIAVENKQEAIYDFETKCSIYTENIKL